MLHLVVFRCRRAVGVDIFDLVFGHAGIRKGRAHRADGRRTVGLGARAVEIIGLFAAAAHDAKNFGTAGKRAFERFQDERTGSFGKDKAAAVL